MRAGQMGSFRNFAFPGGVNRLLPPGQPSTISAHAARRRRNRRDTHQNMRGDQLAGLRKRSEAAGSDAAYETCGPAELAA